MGSEPIIQILPCVGRVGGCRFLGLRGSYVGIDSATGAHIKNVVRMCCCGERMTTLFADDAVGSAVIYIGLMLMLACRSDSTAGADAGCVVAVGLIVTDVMALIADHLVVDAIVYRMMVIVRANSLEEGIGITAVAQMGEEVVVVTIGEQNNIAVIADIAVGSSAVAFQCGIGVCTGTLANSTNALVIIDAVVSAGNIVAVTGTGVGTIAVGDDVIGGVIAGVCAVAYSAAVIGIKSALYGFRGFLLAGAGAVMVTLAVRNGISQRVVAGLDSFAVITNIVGVVAAVLDFRVLTTVTFAGMGAIVVGRVNLQGVVTGTASLAGGAFAVSVVAALGGSGFFSTATLGGMGTVTVGSRGLCPMVAESGTTMLAFCGRRISAGTGLVILHYIIASSAVVVVCIIAVGLVRIVA